MYKVSDVPEWVDHVFSVNSYMDIIDWHYSYQNGYWNFSNTNVYKTAYYYKDSKNKTEENEFTPFEGYNSVVGTDGEIYFSTGLTPANSAETNIGFLMINIRTGEVKFYAGDGAEESSAQAAAEGLVQNLGYSASFPILTNVEGEQTYFMTLKDKAGLVQRYALCNVAQYSKVVQAETISEAVNLYKKKLGIKVEKADGVTSEEENAAQSEKKELLSKDGTIGGVKEVEVDGNTCYYFYFVEEEQAGDDFEAMVKGKEIFISSIKNSSLQPFMLTFGTKVSVEYYASDEPNVNVVTSIKFSEEKDGELVTGGY